MASWAGVITAEKKRHCTACERAIPAGEAFLEAGKTAGNYSKKYVNICVVCLARFFKQASAGMTKAEILYKIL